MTNTNEPTGGPEGYRDVPEEDRKKAKRFFDHAKSVAATAQYDYAIEMFINGLTLDPEDLEQHKLLREMSLKRKASGGKDMGMLERRKYPTSTKDDKQNMLNAERQLAFDPGNAGHMLVFAQSSFRAGFYFTATWIADILLKVNAESPKPDYSKFIALKEIYKGLGDYKQASDACSCALELRPDDMDLKGEMKGLAAEHTLSIGKYRHAKSFRDSIRFRDEQQKLMDDEKDVKTEDILTRKVRDTEADWKATPNDASKFSKYIDALKGTESMEYENIAIEKLDEMFKSTKQFKWRAKAGEIKLSQLSRMDRSYVADLKQHPDDARKKKEYQDFLTEKTKSELEEFQLVVENYPTDTNARWQMARRMFMLRQFQDVIPVLQQVRIDPKHRSDAGTLLGQAFLEAGFIDEAIDTLKTIIDDHLTKGDERSKNMMYWFGRALEVRGDIPAALKQYSLVAQMEFKYKDVQERIKRLRAEAAK